MHSDIWCTCTLHALHVYLAVVRNDFKQTHTPVLKAKVTAIKNS